MNRVMRAAAIAALAAGGTGSIGCVHDGQRAGEGAAGGGAVYRQFVDPCYPERYNATARAEVIAPFAAQVNNGTVLNQTIWNWYFEAGTDKLTPAGRAKLDSIAQTRPVPDSRLYLQAARDVPVTNENIDKVGATPGGNWQRQLSHIVWGSADSVEDAWASLRTIPRRIINNAASEADAKDDGAQAVSSVFVPYVPAKLRGGVPHPSTIVESASMASVTPPKTM